MANHHGKFVWYELMTNDIKGALAFYGAVHGWAGQNVPGMSYTILQAGERPAGGMMTLPAEAAAAGLKPCWLGYIAVDDVDVAARNIKAAGGSIHREPADIPNVGRFAVCADPDGALFQILKGRATEERQWPAPGTPGQIGWHELFAGDGARAFGFYAGLFGWTKADAVDLGAEGTYQIFNIGGAMAGGILNKPSHIPGRPFWLFYVNVADIDAAAARIKSARGELMFGPAPVPGERWIAQARDPQGARFAVIGPKH
jgi:predicted enzyme related to lactoylglutathione lyase